MNSLSTSQISKPIGFLLLLFFMLLSHPMFAQNEKVIDSLQAVLKTAAEDTNKVFTLIRLGRAHAVSRKPDAAKKYFEGALVLATKLNIKRVLAIAYFRIGVITGRQLQDFSESLKNLKEALKIWEDIGDKREIAGTYHNIGLAYLADHNYGESLNYLEIAKKRYEENGQGGLMQDTYNTIGTIHKTLGNYPKALENFYASLSINVGLRNKRGEAANYTNIGNTYRALGNYPEALKNHFSALKLYEETDKRVMPIAYTNIGNSYDELGNYSEALKYHQDALKIWEEAGNKGGIANVLASIGSGNYKQSNYSEALKNYQASLKVYEELKSKNGIASCCIGLGNVHIKLKNFQEASEDLLKALSLSKETGHKENIKEAYEGLCKLDSAMGNFEQALVYLKLYIIYRDSLQNDSTKSQIARIRTQVEFEKKDKEFAQMNEKYLSEKKDKEILQLTSEKQRLENEKQINDLLLKTRQDSFSIVQVNNEKKLQQLQIAKNKADYAVLDKESDIQQLQLNKQKQAKNYMVAGIALLVILSFFFYRSYRTRQKLKLQTLRNKIASDLHDDIGSTLSSISIFSQMAQEQSSETIPLLESIGESSRRMLDAMADIVWTINPENDQFDKIISRMKSFAYELLGAKKIDFEFVADEEVVHMKLPMEVRKNFYLIFKEATNNMVKYAGADRAMFAIRGGKHDLTMKIQDNGKGFDVNRFTEGNGLKNMKKRAEEIGADFVIDSHPGKGTVIELKLAV